MGNTKQTLPFRSLVHGLASIMLVAQAAGAAPTSFNITEIPLPPGAVTASAQGINARGDVVGYCTLATGETLGFVLSAGVSMTLPPLPGQGNSIANDISDGGLVVGYSGHSTAPDKAVVWWNGRPLSLGTFGGAWSAANGCSSTGLAAGWAQVEPTSNRFHGFVHDGTTRRDAGLLPGGLVTELADVNAHGVAVGIGQTIEGHFHAIMVDPAEGMLDLGTLGGLTSEAEAISDAGHITGRAQIGVRNDSTFEGIVRHAFLWHEGRMIDLGTPPGAGLVESRGLGVNSKGQVVGEANNESLTLRKPFLWEDGVMTDLNAILPPGSGWVLRTASAINEAGWIVGDGTHDGQSRAYLLQPMGLDEVRSPPVSRADQSAPPLHQQRGEVMGSAPARTTVNQFYVVRAAGPLPGDAGPTWSWDINDRGAVLGLAHVQDSRESRCFVFEDGRLTPFAADQGHPFIWAAAVNSDGTFVGTQMVTAPIGTKREAFVGAAEFLPDLFPQFPSARASFGRAINNATPPWAAGSQRLEPTIGTGGFSTFGAYLVLLDGNPNPAIALSALGGVFGRAEALNDARDVAGASLTATGPLRAFLRPGAGGATVDLGTLGGSHSWATKVNNASQVVGWSRVADGGTRAFLYQDSVMIDLGSLGGNISEAQGINEAGRIVGMSFNAQCRPRAFLYDSGIMIDLNERIATGSGWTLQAARTINGAGSIAGWGRLDGETRGFVLVPRGRGDATLDGVVDIVDFLAILGAWGACAPPCASDFNGDGVVNADDLSDVIANWG